MVGCIKGGVPHNNLAGKSNFKEMGADIGACVTSGLKLGLEGNNWKHDESEKNPA